MRFHLLLVVASGLPALLAQSISRTGRCGAQSGLTCAGSTYGSCCSQYNYCGVTSGHCGNGCQSGYGTCTPASPSGSASKISMDGSCGGTKSQTCLNSAFGNCCSRYGFCGKSSAYCGQGCNPSFGSCDIASSATKVTTPTPGSTSSSRATISTSTKTVVAMPSPSSFQKVSTNARCGNGFGGQTCLGSQWGDCCSQWFYCGSTADYCRPESCQTGFGRCESLSSSAQLSTTLTTSTRSNLQSHTFTSSKATSSQSSILVILSSTAHLSSSATAFSTSSLPPSLVTTSSSVSSTPTLSSATTLVFSSVTSSDTRSSTIVSSSSIATVVSKSSTVSSTISATSSTLASSIPSSMSIVSGSSTLSMLSSLPSMDTSSTLSSSSNTDTPSSDMKLSMSTPTTVTVMSTLATVLASSMDAVQSSTASSSFSTSSVGTSSLSTSASELMSVTSSSTSFALSHPSTPTSSTSASSSSEIHLVPPHTSTSTVPKPTSFCLKVITPNIPQTGWPLCTPGSTMGLQVVDYSYVQGSRTIGIFQLSGSGQLRVSSTGYVITLASITDSGASVVPWHPTRSTGLYVEPLCHVGEDNEFKCSVTLGQYTYNTFGIPGADGASFMMVDKRSASEYFYALRLGVFLGADCVKPS